MPTRWITVAEARELVPEGYAWMRAPGPTRDCQHSAARDRPVFLYENGDMYLGAWKEFGAFFPKAKPSGWGAYCSQSESISVGAWAKGMLHGPACLWWIPTAPVWLLNREDASCIKVDGVGVPFIYIGEYKKDRKNDPTATVILKDGTTRLGPWKDDKFVGKDWFLEHRKRPTKTAEEMEALLKFGFVEDEDNKVPSPHSSVIPQALVDETRKQDPMRRVFSARKAKKVPLAAITDSSRSFRSNHSPGDESAESSTEYTVTRIDMRALIPEEINSVLLQPKVECVYSGSRSVKQSMAPAAPPIESRIQSEAKEKTIERKASAHKVREKAEETATESTISSRGRDKTNPIKGEAAISEQRLSIFESALLGIKKGSSDIKVNSSRRKFKASIKPKDVLGKVTRLEEDPTEFSSSHNDNSANTIDRDESGMEASPGIAPFVPSEPTHSSGSQEEHLSPKVSSLSFQTSDPLPMDTNSSESLLPLPPKTPQHKLSIDQEANRSSGVPVKPDTTAPLDDTMQRDARDTLKGTPQATPSPASSRRYSDASNPSPSNSNKSKPRRKKDRARRGIIIEERIVPRPRSLSARKSRRSLPKEGRDVSPKIPRSKDNAKKPSKATTPVALEGESSKDLTNNGREEAVVSLLHSLPAETATVEVSRESLINAEGDDVKQVPISEPQEDNLDTPPGEERVLPRAGSGTHLERLEETDNVGSTAHPEDGTKSFVTFPEVDADLYEDGMSDSNHPPGDTPPPAPVLPEFPDPTGTTPQSLMSKTYASSTDNEDGDGPDHLQVYKTVVEAETQGIDPQLLLEQLALEDFDDLPSEIDDDNFGLPEELEELEKAIMAHRAHDVSVDLPMQTAAIKDETDRDAPIYPPDITSDAISVVASEVTMPLDLQGVSGFDQNYRRTQQRPRGPAASVVESEVTMSLALQAAADKPRFGPQDGMTPVGHTLQHSRVPAMSIVASEVTMPLELQGAPRQHGGVSPMVSSPADLPPSQPQQRPASVVASELTLPLELQGPTGATLPLNQPDHMSPFPGPPLQLPAETTILPTLHEPPFPIELPYAPIRPQADIPRGITVALFPEQQEEIEQNEMMARLLSGKASQRGHRKKNGDRQSPKGKKQPNKEELELIIGRTDKKSEEYLKTKELLSSKHSKARPKVNANYYEELKKSSEKARKSGRVSHGALRKSAISHLARNKDEDAKDAQRSNGRRSRK